MSPEEKVADQSNEYSETLKEAKSQQAEPKPTKQADQQKSPVPASATNVVPATQTEETKENWELPKPDEKYFK